MPNYIKIGLHILNITIFISLIIFFTYSYLTLPDNLRNKSINIIFLLSLYIGFLVGMSSLYYLIKSLPIHQSQENNIV